MKKFFFKKKDGEKNNRLILNLKYCVSIFNNTQWNYTIPIIVVHRHKKLVCFLMECCFHLCSQVGHF